MKPTTAADDRLALLRAKASDMSGPAETRRHARREIRAILDNNAHVLRRREVMVEAARPAVAAAVSRQRAVGHVVPVPSFTFNGTAADLSPHETRSVDDPSETPAQLIAKRAKKPGDPRVGKIDVTGNAMTRIGALCYIRKRLRHHEQAAERFKSLYESLYGSGMPAVDAGRVQVDTSIMAHDAGMASRLDRGADLFEARLKLGRRASDLLVSVIVLGVPCTELADGDGWRARERVVDELLAVLDQLSVEWGYGRAA